MIKYQFQTRKERYTPPVLRSYLPFMGDSYVYCRDLGSEVVHYAHLFLVEDMSAHSSQFKTIKKYILISSSKFLKHFAA